MKKTKLLMPLLGISSIAAVAVPLVSCGGPTSGESTLECNTLQKYGTDQDAATVLTTAETVNLKKDTVYTANFNLSVLSDDDFDKTQPKQIIFAAAHMDGGQPAGTGAFDKSYANIVKYNDDDWNIESDYNPEIDKPGYESGMGFDAIIWFHVDGDGNWLLNKNDKLSLVFKLTEDLDTAYLFLMLE